MDRSARLRQVAWVVMLMTLTTSGCTSMGDYLRNGFKVGPNAAVPQGATAERWIDESDVRLREDPVDLERWWTIFRDPTLDQLIASATRQNLTLREACYRVLQSRAELGIAQGNIFPQKQEMFGAYRRVGGSQVTNDYWAGFGNQFFDQWNLGFNLTWEMDLWGRLRRAVASAEDTLEASVANYDDVLVTLLGDVATNYVQVRTLQERMDLVRSNVELQSRILVIADRRYHAGRKNALDSHQARSNLAQTEAQIPQLRIELRQACNRLCVLLGMPPADLERQIGPGPIPTAPTSVAIGIPADLLRRRPDVRRAERQAASQGQQIGIAEADLYPMFAINGSLGYQASNFSQLVTSPALNSMVGPQFQWNILNYGRIRNNVRAQDAKFQAMVAVYQNTVLKANAEVENGLAAFLHAQERTKLLNESVDSAQKAVDIVFKEYRVGTVDFNRVALIEQNLVQQQDLQAQSHGEIAQGLIRVYRALGGGWQLGPDPATVAPLPPTRNPNEVVPTPPPDGLNAPAEPAATYQRRKLPMPEDASHVRTGSSAMVAPN
ncbi:MAG: efflux transporter outer membrane subunit [Planctomycetaceae bacterium]|nr:efflux transporter outer membrane subunit [Planctomycetaceae bacterium]